MFTWLPQLKAIAYVLPDTQSLFPPLNSGKYNLAAENINIGDNTLSPFVNSPTPLLENIQSPYIAFDTKQIRQESYLKRMKRNQKKGLHYFNLVNCKNPLLNFQLSLCFKKEWWPTLKIRKSRVEDCDDLTPMLKKQNVTFTF